MQQNMANEMGTSYKGALSVWSNGVNCALGLCTTVYEDFWKSVVMETLNPETLNPNQCSCRFGVVRLEDERVARRVNSHQHM